MNNILQDMLGNILLFAVSGIMAHVLPRRKYFVLRVIACFVGFCALRYVYFNVIGQYVPRDLGLFYRMLGFLLLLVLTAVSVYLCFDTAGGGGALRYFAEARRTASSTSCKCCTALSRVAA